MQKMDCQKNIQNFWDGILVQLIKRILASIGENIIGLAIHLFSMILVERQYGHQGLGVFAYFISVYHLAGFIAEFGIPSYFKSNYAVFKKENTDLAFLNSCVKTMLFSSLICSFFFFANAFWSVTLTEIDEEVIGYLIIGLAIPFKNLNRLIVAKLQVEGDISFVSKISTAKHIIFIISLYFLTTFNIRASHLFISFLLAELFFLFTTIWKINVFKLFFKKVKIFQTLAQSYNYLFYEKALDIFFYIDFLIIGLFMSAQKLGIYAETGVFIRFFLLITMSLKPIIQRYFIHISMNQSSIQFKGALFKICGLIFYLNSVLCLYFLFYYDSILNYFFLTRGEESVSLIIFIYTLPGLIFFSVASVFEVYISMSYHFKKQASIISKVMLLNLILNLYLIEFSGLYGAAIATMISMLAYFLLIVNCMNINVFKAFGLNYIAAGSVLYLFYKASPAMNLAITILIFMLLAIVYYFIGIFDIKASIQEKSIKLT